MVRARTIATCQYCDKVIFDTYERLRHAEEARLWDAHFNVCAKRAAVKARAKRNAEAQRGPGMDWLAADGWH